MTDFTGKIALVTGAASGIGLAIAERFINDGGTVVGTDINEELLSSVAGDLGPRFIPQVSNAGKVADIKSVADFIKNEFGRLDCLINNAGIGVIKNPEDLTEEEYDLGMDVLLKGPVFFIKYTAEMLRASENGSVVNMSSASSVISVPSYTPYALAKAAIDKLTRDCVVQVPGVRHNSIQPGVINTPILNNTYGKEAADGFLKAAEVLTPCKRYGVAADVANAVAFLCSDQASYINGVNIPVDGGLSQVSALAAEAVAAA
jgi:NAD(P)-dependent dehydrogenase (short-subunit alcohol dehydrogenase family)